jgi:hypothetical protein
LDIYTFQLGKLENLLFSDIPYYDTTVKSGLWQLAPTWEIVMGVKSRTISEEQYTALYWDMLLQRYHMYPEFFDWLIAHPNIAFGCYCIAGKFCHRHIIVEFLKHITEVRYCGEL